VAPATHQPDPGDTQGNVSRQLAGAVVLGGWSCTSAATRGERALLRFFNSSGLVKRAVPRPSGAAPEGLAGMPELRAWAVGSFNLISGVYGRQIKHRSAALGPESVDTKT
jgi:hypothetical protein